MAYFIAAYITKWRFTVLTKYGGGDHKRRLSVQSALYCTMQCVQCTLEKQCTANHVIKKWPSRLRVKTGTISMTMLGLCQLNNEIYMFWARFPQSTHWGQGKRAAILQTTLSTAFSLMKMFEFRLEFHWSLSIRIQLTIFQHWFR